MNHCCGSCRYFLNKPSEAIGANRGRLVGSCRRYPVSTEKAGTDWCGEFSPRIGPETTFAELREMGESATAALGARVAALEDRLNMPCA